MFAMTFVLSSSLPVIGVKETSVSVSPTFSFQLRVHGRREEIELVPFDPLGIVASSGVALYESSIVLSVDITSQ